MESETKRRTSAQRQWCPDCRSRSAVVDQFTESHYEPAGEMGYRVTELSCGHYLETTPVKVGPAPGAPSVAGALPNLTALMRPERWETCGPNAWDVVTS